MAVVSFVSLAIAVSNKCYVLILGVLILWLTSYYLTQPLSVSGQRDLGKGGTFGVDCPPGT